MLSLLFLTLGASLCWWSELKLTYFLITQQHAGQLTEAYELGNRYIIPKYCLSKPTNVQGSATTGYNPLPSRGLKSKRQEDGHKASGIPMTIKVRQSTIRKDLKVTVLTTDM